MTFNCGEIIGHIKSTGGVVVVPRQKMAEAGNWPYIPVVVIVVVGPLMVKKLRVFTIMRVLITCFQGLIYASNGRRHRVDVARLVEPEPPNSIV